jgi:hypothetical protein
MEMEPSQPLLEAFGDEGSEEMVREREGCG